MKKEMKQFSGFGLRFLLSLCLCVSIIINAFAQIENPPAPSAPRAAKIPAISESELPNGLKVVVAERKNVPLVTATLLIRNGADIEDLDSAGLANLTAALLLKGTKTRTAPQIAEQMEFLGGTIDSGASWNTTEETINVASDKLDAAMAIMSDTILNPTFLAKEVALSKTQTLDDLNLRLKQPSSLADFVARRYSFGEHSPLGTPQTISKITRAGVSSFYRRRFTPDNAILVFAGDVSPQAANALAKKYFGKWTTAARKEIIQIMDQTPMVPPRIDAEPPQRETSTIGNILVIDLPNSGQAAVSYAKQFTEGRTGWSDASKKTESSAIYYSALVSNTVLGGGYSARLNAEIRIKQGLSYGARSTLDWRQMESNFFARAQTKNVSAAQVAELLTAEIEKLGSGAIPQEELTARELTLTGDFGRDLETTQGLAERIGELYYFDLKADDLNSYTRNVQKISDLQVNEFASENMKGGDLIIVGDAKEFIDDLKKRFPNQKIEIIKASDLDLSRDDLRKRFDPGKPLPRKAK